MKILSLITLLAFGPTLSAMSWEKKPETYMELLPRDIPSYVLLPYLLEDTDSTRVIQSVAKYLKTVQRPDQITLQQVEELALLINAKTLRAPLHIMLLFFDSGIPAAREWLQTHADTDDIIILLKDFQVDPKNPILQALVVPILKYDPKLEPKLAANRLFLKAVMQSNFPSLIRYFVNREPRVLLPLADAFPLRNPEIALILEKAFGLPALLTAEAEKKYRAEDAFSLGVVKALMPTVFANPDNFVLLLKAAYDHSSTLRTNPEFLNMRNDRGETILMKLIEYNRSYSARAASNILIYRFIEDSDIHAKDSEGQTALIKAVKKVDLNAIKLLLARGADAFQTDVHGKNALDYARGSTAVKRLLAEQLHIAEEELFPPLVNEQDELGQTALIDATRTGNIATARSLLDRGADPFIEDLTKATAIHYARGNTAMMNLFAEKLGVDVRELFPGPR